MGSPTFHPAPGISRTEHRLKRTVGCPLESGERLPSRHDLGPHDDQPAKVPVPTGSLAGDGAAFGPRGGGLSLNNAPAAARAHHAPRAAGRRIATAALMNAAAARVPTLRAPAP